MRLEFAVLADYASITNDGKLNAMGVFRDIYTQVVPSVHAHLSLAWLSSIEDAERGKPCHLGVFLRNPDGDAIFSLEGDLSITEDIPTGYVMPQTIELTRLRFEQFGDYTFQIVVDDEVIGTVPLHLKPLPKEG